MSADAMDEGLLTNILRSSFTAAVRGRGEAYRRQDHLESLESHSEVLKARVQGSGGRVYSVRLEWDKALVLVAGGCNCPHFKGGDFCKHLWALILAAGDEPWGRSLRADLDAMPGASKLLELVHGSLRGYSVSTGGTVAVAAFDNPGEIDARTRSARGRIAQVDFQAGAAICARSHWEHRLDALFAPAQFESAVDELASRRPAQRTAWFVLDLPRSQEYESPVVRFAHRLRHNDGSLGDLREAGVDRHTLGAYETRADAELIEALLGTGAQDLDRFAPPVRECRIVPSLYAPLFSSLVASGRLLLRTESKQPLSAMPVARVWDTDAWSLEPLVTDDSDAAEWQFSARWRCGEQLRPVDDALLALPDGLVVFEDRIAPAVRPDDADEWMWRLIDDPVVVPHSERAKFNELLWRRDAPPPVELPPTLAYEVRSVPPRGWLELDPEVPAGVRRNRAAVLLRIAVVYGECPVSPWVSSLAAVDHENGVAWRRDREAEIQLLAPLEALPWTTDPRRPPDLREARMENVLEVLTTCRSLGWSITSHSKPVRISSGMGAQVTSGMDWLDVSASIDFEGVSASLPDVLGGTSAISEMVSLSDGSIGWLPLEWLEEEASWLKLGKPEGERVRFRRAQALMLDHLLDARQVTWQHDREFSRARAAVSKLAVTSKGAKPPAGFTGELRGYQREGLAWLERLRKAGVGGCLADDMGLGKTVQVLAQLEAERRRSKKDNRPPSLVVVPNSLVFNWLSEAHRFVPKLEVMACAGPKRAALRERFSEVDVVLTTYGTLRQDAVALAAIAFHYVVLDEAQAIKNPRSQVSKACRTLNATHRLAVSGTPVENHLGDLWAIFEFLNPGLLGGNKTFIKLTREARESEAARQAVTALGTGLAPFMLRRTKEEAAPELPPKTEQTLLCELGSRQRKLYDELRDYYRQSLVQRVGEVGMGRSKVHVLEALLRLRQTACHPALVREDMGDEASAKLDLLVGKLDELAQEKRKVLVFSQFTKLLKVVRDRLDHAKIAFEYLDGRTRDRAARVQRFQETPDLTAFLISLKAGGHGLNLTAADYVYILDPWWNPAVEAQAVDRAHRIGQTRPVFAYRMIAADTVEEKIVELQQHKKWLADAVMARNSSLLADLAMEDLEFLLS